MIVERLWPGNAYRNFHYLIACAETGRVARCIELDPGYCDVIRRRWTRYAKEHGLDPGTGALDG